MDFLYQSRNAHWNNYMSIENYISSIITINPNKEKNINEICRLKNRTKNYYKKIIQKNNIVFKWENDFDTFYPILINNKSKHNSSPTHSINELKKIDKILPGKLELLLMYSDDKPIGGSLLINANKRVRIIFYNMVDYNYVHLQPATLQSIEIISPFCSGLFPGIPCTTSSFIEIQSEFGKS